MFLATLHAGLLLPFLFGVFQGAPPTAINSDKPLSVCDVLRDLGQYRGKVIEVRGQWDGYLSGNCPKMTTGNYTWPNAILVVPVETAAVSSVYMPTWTGLDWGLYNWALKGAQADIARLPAGMKEKATITATIVGLLDARDPPLSLTGFGEPQGYGHLGGYPAQMVLITVKDIALMVAGTPVNAPLERPSNDR